MTYWRLISWISLPLKLISSFPLSSFFSSLFFSLEICAIQALIIALKRALEILLALGALDTKLVLTSLGKIPKKRKEKEKEKEKEKKRKKITFRINRKKNCTTPIRT
jgi:hypothetical protein